MADRPHNLTHDVLVAALDLVTQHLADIHERADEAPLSWLDDDGLLHAMHAAWTLTEAARVLSGHVQDRAVVRHLPGWGLRQPHTGELAVVAKPTTTERHDVGLVLWTVATQVYDTTELPAQARAMVERFEALLTRSTKLSLPAVRAAGLTDDQVVTRTTSAADPTITYTPPKD